MTEDRETRGPNSLPPMDSSAMIDSKTDEAAARRNAGLPTVAIVVPAYNAAGTIGPCLQSLSNLSYPKPLYTIVVVDNRSTDSTPEIAKGFQATILQESGRRSSYAARNAGIRQSSSEIVAFTDADCIAAPDWLQHLVAPFEREDVGATTGRIMDFEPSTPVEQFIANLGLWNSGEAVSGWPIVLTGNAAVRRRCLLQLGLFNDRLYTGADVDLGWRIHKQLGQCVIHIPEALVRHKNYATVPAMYRQFRRHGFGEILLDALHRKDSGYFRPAGVQLNRMLKQTLACLNYVRAFLIRSVLRVIGRCPRDRQIAAAYWLVAEGGNLIGKLHGLWETRFFRMDPGLLDVEDPGER